MKILQIYPLSMKVRRGGIPEHVWNISKRLAKKHDVTLFGLNPHNRYSRFEVVDGVKVERFRHFYPSDAYFFSFELPLRLRQAEFDVVHGHSYHAFPMHFATLAKYHKFIATPHYHGGGHSVFRNSLFRLFEPFGGRTLRKANFIVAVSEFEKEILSDKFGFVKNKITVIPNGLDLSEFINLKRETDDFKRVLYVGRLEPYKGVQHLVQILPKLENNVVLEIVGTGPSRKQLETEARRLGVLERVSFYENLPRNELLQKYVNADAFVLLSRFEAYSIAVAEALTAGTPCIVANTSALCEWIDNVSCFGIDFPIGLNKLAETVNYVLNNVEKLSVASTGHIGSKILDWSEVVARLENLYT